MGNKTSVSDDAAVEKRQAGGTGTNLNIHQANPDIKIHSTYSMNLDADHDKAMKIPLGEVTDEQLLAEVARRKIDIHSQITDALVRESYNFESKLGKGASGQVYLVSHKVTGIKYACKVIQRDGNMNDAESMSTEMEIMKRIRHRNIVSMYELYETSKCLWVILELVDGGDLHDYLSKIDHYTESVAAKQMKQILAALHYIHSLGVVHRDIKLDNILLKGTGEAAEVKLADFGLSALVRLDEGGYDPHDSAKRKRYRKLTEVWGTKEYFAPELIDGAYGPQADMWSLGCVLYEMLVGKVAFPWTRDEDELFGRIRRGTYDTRAPSYENLSSEAKALISAMLTTDPTRRISASEALQHPWITSGGSSTHLKEAHSVIKDKAATRGQGKYAVQA